MGWGGALSPPGQVRTLTRRTHAFSSPPPTALQIHSFSVDWLYQAVLYIFSGTIKHQIEEGLGRAVHTVRGAMNGGREGARQGGTRVCWAWP